MTPEAEFWWSWWADAAVAFGTIVLAIAAVFGGRISSWLFRPRLTLRLLSPQGEPTDVNLTWTSAEGEQKSRTESARYYHLRVSNERRWPPATQVQVYLLRLEEPRPDGQHDIVWSGDIPLRWRHQEVHPLTRTVGHDADCDLCSVVKGKWVQLHPLVTPMSFPAKHRNRAHLQLVVQARAVETDSAPLRIQIDWDGEWRDGATEMMRHMVVRERRD